MIAMQTLQIELNQCQQAREELWTEHKRAKEALHKLQEELELRVQQRTAELTQANQALQENLERYQVFVATTSEGIWCFELAVPIPIHLPLEEQIDLIYRHAKLAECNDVFAHTYGYKQAKEITGARLPHFTPDKFQNRDYLRTFISSGYRLTDGETREEDRHANIHFILNNLVGIINNDCLVRVWGTQRDITERKQLEEAFQASEERFRAIFEQSPMSMQILAPDGRTLEVNRAYEELWGITHSNLVNWSYLEDQQLTNAGVATLIQQAFAGEATMTPPTLYDPFQVGENATTKGCVRWVQGFHYPVKDEAGVREVVLMHRDVSALKQAEQLARGQTEVLTRTLNLLATAPDLDKFLGQVLTAIAEQLQVYSSHLFFYEPAQDTLRLHVTYHNGDVFPGNPPTAVLIPEHIPADHTPFWPVLVQKRGPLVLDNLANNPLIWPEHRLWHLQAGVKVALAIPLMVGEEAIGFFGIRRTQHEHFSPEEVELAQALAQQATLAIQLTRLAEQSRQTAVLQEREKIAQERAQQLVQYNEELRRRDALLNGVAEAAQRLISIDDFDTAAKGALSAIAEASGIDRIYIFQNYFDDSTGQDMVVCPYEWTIPGLPRSSDIPGRYPMTYDGFEGWLEEMKAGRPMQGLARDMPEPAQGLQTADCALSLLAVPIAVNGQYWGIIEFDDCHGERLWNDSEIAVLQTAAACLAGAIQRRDLRAEREKAVQERAAQLAKANEALSSSLSCLADEPDLDAFLGHVLLEVSQQVAAATGHIFFFEAATNTLKTRITVQDGQVHPGTLADDPELFQAPFPADLTPAFPQACQTREITLLNLATFDGTVWPGTLEWHHSMGHREAALLALMIADQPLGALGLAWRQKTALKPEELELIHALANQTVLAIQLTRLAEEVKQSAVLEERNRMAREIHDTLAQALTGIVVHQEAAKRLLPREEAAREHIDWTLILARQGLEEARRSVWALRASLKQNSLPDTLAHLVEQMTSSLPVEAIFGLRGTPCSLPKDMESDLLRIGQEAVTNALKHASAQQLHIELIFEAQQVRLRIQDDGLGFAASPKFHDELATGKGFGLIGMQERAERLGGQLTITSQPGKGTEVAVTIPLLAS